MVEHLDSYNTRHKKLSPASVNFSSRIREELVIPKPACGKSERLYLTNIG
jgi:hypothetical protein